MFALIAAILLIIGVFVVPLQPAAWMFWLFLALASYFLHHAFGWGFPGGFTITRRNP